MRQTKAFSLIELAIAMGVIGILATSVVPIAIRSVEIKAAEKTATEVLMIQQASQNYYNDHGDWPNDISILQSQGYLNSAWSPENPWHHPYEISHTTQLTVATEVVELWAKLVASHLPVTTVNLGVVTSTITTSDTNSIPIGSILPWASSMLPMGFLWCTGDLLNISDYPKLYAAIGSIYGGDGVNTFALPDLRERTIVGVDQMGGSVAANRITLWGRSPSTLGGTFGEDKHRLTISEMPRHNHDLSLYTPNNGGNSRIPQDSPGPSDATSTIAVQYAGGDQPHNIIQPSIALGYIIKY